MVDLKRNNLDKASSPYLRQHQINPIFWQEWNETTLDHAKSQDKPILVSIGYSTCHWCHVMAAEAFSDEAVAKYLNEHFVCIKVDREQRPDIDSFFMDFIVTTNGSGGWPLNVFLTSDSKPIVGLTYIPVQPKYGMPAFIDILKRVREHGKIANWKAPVHDLQEEYPEEDVVRVILGSHDRNNGGFGSHQKFPPHNTLLFLLYELGSREDENVRQLLKKTLDSIAYRGLHDHLQGGFYRYCVDPRWTIPHFEKMLYDQAMLLWVFALASNVLKEKEYGNIAQKILKCLSETFEHDGLYYCAHDADTEHVEGITYIWAEDEIKNVLSVREYEEFTNVYFISKNGNFEGKNHLIKKRRMDMVEVEEKLLHIRKKRPQPFVDKKIVTSWNALLGVSMVNYWRNTGDNQGLEKADDLFQKLLSEHFKNGKLIHSSINGISQEQEFLEDYASMLMLSTYLYEDTGKYKKEMELFTQKVQDFKAEGWLESNNADFLPVSATGFDHPYPSSISLAEMGLLRTDILLGRPTPPRPYKSPLNHDFYNILAQVSGSRWHMIHSPTKMSWDGLPANIIQVKANHYQDCYGFKCVCYSSEEDLLKGISGK